MSAPSLANRISSPAWAACRSSDATSARRRAFFDYQKIWVSSGVAKDGDRGDHWLVFTKRPPAKVFATLAALGTDTNVLFGAPATAREIRRLSRAVFDPYGASASVSYSLEPRAVRPG